MSPQIIDPWYTTLTGCLVVLSTATRPKIAAAGAR